METHAATSPCSAFCGRPPRRADVTRSRWNRRVPRVVLLIIILLSIADDVRVVPPDRSATENVWKPWGRAVSRVAGPWINHRDPFILLGIVLSDTHRNSAVYTVIRRRQHVQNHRLLLGGDRSRCDLRLYRENGRLYVNTKKKNNNKKNAYHVYSARARIKSLLVVRPYIILCITKCLLYIISGQLW